MNYRVAGTMPSVRPGLWNRDYPLAKRSLLEGGAWQRVGLFAVLGLCLVLVALASARSSSPLVPVALVVALILAVYAILRPGFALLLVLAGASLPSIIIPLSFHTMHLIEPALALCMLIVTLHRPSMRLRLPHLLALLFLGIAIISFIHVPTISTDPNADAADKELYSVALYIIALFVGTFLVDAIKNFSSFLVAVLLCNIPLYLIGLGQALGLHVFSFLEDSAAQDPLQAGGRLWGPFIGATTFGSYLVVLLAVALACWLLGARRRDRIIGAVMTAATLLEIVGSGTRSAAIAAVIIVIVACVMTQRFKLLLGTIVLSGIIVAIFLGKILSKFTHDVASTSNRLYLWQVALQLIHSHPWIGIGLGQFQVYYSQLIIPRSTQLNPNGVSVHNQYLSWALSSGIIWMIVGVALLGSILYACAKAYRKVQREQQVLILAALLAALATVVVCFVDVPLEKTEGAVFLFLLAGLAIGIVERVHSGKPAERIPYTSVLAASPTGLDLSVPGRLRGHSGHTSRSARTAAGEIDAEEEAPNAQKTGRSVVLQLISWGISAAIIFPATALLTRYLGPVQYGEYSFTIPFLSIFAVFSGTGMDPLITRTLSTQRRSKWSETLSFAAGTRLLSTLTVSVFAALIAFALPVSAEQRVLLLLGSGCLLFSFSFNGLRTVYECGFWAEQRFAIPSLVEALDRVVTSSLIVVAILFRLSLAWTYILIVYSDIPFFLALVFFARRRFHINLRFHLARIREYLIGSLSLTIHNALSMLVSQVNLLLLLPLAGSFSVGLYGLGLRIMSPLLSIAIMYMIGLYPLLCSQFVAGRKQFSAAYSEMTRIVALSIIPLAIFATIEAKSIVLLLGGERFVAATLATQVLVWAVVATFFGQLAIRGCMAANLEHSIPYVTGIALAVNVLACVLLIPHLQAVGAAVAALSCQLIAFLLFTILLARHVDLVRVASMILRVVLGTLPALAFIFWQANTSLLFRAPVFVLLAVVGCAVVRTLSLKDVSMAMHILLGRKDTASSEKVDTTNQPIVIVPKMHDVADQDTASNPH